jgi:hypothetical protein
MVMLLWQDFCNLVVKKQSAQCEGEIVMETGEDLGTHPTKYTPKHINVGDSIL